MTQELAEPDDVYRVSAGMRTLAACFLVPLIGLCAVGPFWMLAAMHGSAGEFAVVLLLGLLLAGLFGYLLWSAFRTRLEFLPEGIRYTGGWGEPRELSYDEVEGYRVQRGRNTRIMQLVPKDASGKPLRIDMSFGRLPELSKRLDEKFRNLDAEDLKAEMKEVMADERLGFSEEERLSALAGAQTKARILGGAAFGLTLWAMIYPKPYLLVMTLLAVLPAAAIALVKTSNGALTIDDRRRPGARPSVAYAVISPGMVLALRAFLDWHILDWSAFWVPFGVLGASMCALVWYASGTSGPRKMGPIAVTCASCLLHGYGLTLFLNCALDRSNPVAHQTVVRSHQVSHGKSTTYYITVSPWLDGPGYRQISVPLATYNAHPVGSAALVLVRGGRLAIPWFFVR